MKIKIFLSVLCLSLFCVAAHTQVAGYMGRRFYIQGSILFFPAIRPTTVGNAHLGTGFFRGVNYKANVMADYTITRATSFGLSFDYTETAYSTSDSYALDMMYVGFYFKFHRGKAVAPQGMYYRVGLQVGIQNSYRPGNTNNRMDYSLVIHQSFGKNTILARRLVLDTGFDFNITAPLTVSLTDNPGTRAFYHNMIMIRCGLGILLF